MKNSYNKFIASIGRMGIQDFIYPAVVILFLVVVMIAFSFTAQFISKSISKAFLVESPQESLKLDVPAYNITAKKLNFTVGSI